ncbi:Hpt domain-containing protein [Telmatobacter sp. DSM 110680]|uniref:Hpt domain-containing protein n=1 Tax=Telmatobacter sp. DSM 110680 TaxID=3036704 RepID=A0AAU7DJJ7_9BACT
MSGPQDPVVAEAMNRLWQKYLPQIEERVATLQRAADSLASGDLSPIEQKKAASDAHKLAGVLGTFGLTDGTDLAREAEGLYEGSEEEMRRLAARLATIAEGLQAMIANRK